LDSVGVEDGRRRNGTISGVTPAAIGTTITGTTGDAPDATPRAAVIGLLMVVRNNGTIRGPFVLGLRF
jgi:hypothetical protein